VRVAILSAMETVNPEVPSTIEAAALCKMADRGQLTGATLDGPLALDNGDQPQRGADQEIDSRSAGRANVLIVPDLEAGNMLAKSCRSRRLPTPPESSSAPRCRSSSRAAPTPRSRGWRRARSPRSSRARRESAPRRVG
jgi:hypothetical protein